MTRLLDALRLVLLALTLCAGVAAWVFARAPERLAAIDASAVRRATDEPLREARALARRVEEDPVAGLRGLDEFLDAHSDVGRGNRGFSAPRLARRARIDALLAGGDRELALREALEWAAEDPRDLSTRLWAGRLAAKHGPGSPLSERGLAVLEDAFAELPELGVTTRALAEVRLDLGDAAGALDAICEHLALAPRALLSQEGLDRAWDVWASVDGAEREPPADAHASCTLAVTHAYVALTFDLPEGAQRLRIDPPGGSHLAFDRAIFAIVRDSGTASLDLSAVPIDATDMTFDGLRMVVDGAADPGFRFTLPQEHVGSAAQARLVLATQRPPRWMENALASAPPVAFEAALERLVGTPSTRVIDAASGAARAREVRSLGAEGR